MTRWRLDLEYDGTAFSGWQLQPGQRTVQGVVETAVARVFGEDLRLAAAGRTDSGVHALHQVAVFDADAVRPERGVLLGMNAALPDDVAVWAARRVPESFDPRHEPHAKRYRYTWWTREGRSPVRRFGVWHHPAPLDGGAMAEAVTALVGTHDYESFRAAGCGATHAVRTVPVARVDVADEAIHLVMEGTGFLRNMIRIVAGSLTEVGRGRWTSGRLGEVLAARDRTQAGPTAPPQGLTLERIWYVGEAGAPSYVGRRGFV